jgi:two-component sensor histidine kinase
MSPTASLADSTASPTTLFRRFPVRWAVVFGGWLLLSLILAPETYLFFLSAGTPIPWRTVLTLTGANAAIAAAFAPLIVWLTHRRPLAQGRIVPALLVHVPACILFAAVHTLVYFGLCYTWHEVGQTLFVRFHPNLLTYWAIVGLTEAVMYLDRCRARERELAQAQLQLLRNQLHPHFLFNTLHTVSAMMHEDVKAADRMMSRLSELLRLTLDNIGRHEVTLREETEFLTKYLEIQQVRFQRGLDFVLEATPEALDALVPTMLLQPLVENSIRHGFGGRTRSGRISIRAARSDGRLMLTVADDGRGLGELPKESQGGLGLANLRRRLEQLYSGRAALSIENAPAGGALVTIDLPFRTGPAPSPG